MKIAVPTSLALVLATSFAATAEAGLSNQTKCDSGKILAASKFARCRIKVDFLAEKKGAKFTDEDKQAAYAKCEAKFASAHTKLEDRYPETMSGGDDECTSYGDAANVSALLIATGDAVADGSASTDGTDAVNPFVIVTTEFFGPNRTQADCPAGTSVVTGGISAADTTCHWNQLYETGFSVDPIPAWSVIHVDFASEVDTTNNRVNCEYRFGWTGSNFQGMTPTGDWSGCDCVAVCR